MRIDFYTKEKLYDLPLIGCRIVKFQYDYEERRVFIACRGTDPEQECFLEFCGVLFHSLQKSKEGTQSTEKIVEIRILKDCVPLKQLLDFQAERNAEGESYSARLLQANKNVLSIEIKTAGGNYLFICEAVRYRQRRSAMSETDKLLTMLDCHNPPEVQEKGIELAQNVECLSIFFRPLARRELWENCAKVISKRTDEELSDYTEALFDWAGDRACPGASSIRNRLAEMSPGFLTAPFCCALEKAVSANDFFGSAALQNFARQRNDLWELLPEKMKDLLSAGKCH